MAAVITRRGLLAGGFASGLLFAPPTQFSFWVFGLLKPTLLNVYAHATSRLHCGTALGESILEGGDCLRVEADNTPISVTGPDRAAVAFHLEIPGIIRRLYFGTLRVTSVGRLLYAVVSMDREVAVSSIVGAELPARSAPLAALAVQAVAARSFLCAAPRARHSQAQFCDTTHCQFLRAPAPRSSLVDTAARSTQSLVLAAGPNIIPAHYSAACGGQTVCAELDHYLYSSVVCETCRRDHVARRGHGLGLCQTGAMSLARSGWRWQGIAAKYYPGSVIRTI